MNLPQTGNQDFVRYSLALESTWLPVPFTPLGNSRTTLKSFTKGMQAPYHHMMEEIQYYHPYNSSLSIQQTIIHETWPPL